MDAISAMTAASAASSFRDLQLAVLLKVRDTIAEQATAVTGLVEAAADLARATQRESGRGVDLTA